MVKVIDVSFLTTLRLNAKLKKGVCTVMFGKKIKTEHLKIGPKRNLKMLLTRNMLNLIKEKQKQKL